MHLGSVYAAVVGSVLNSVIYCSMPATHSKCADPTVCKHPPRAGDPHPICEGCRKARFGAESLCTLDKRCRDCIHLSEEEFNALLLVRERNELKNKQKAQRKMRKAQSVSAPVSPAPSASSNVSMAVDLSSSSAAVSVKPEVPLAAPFDPNDVKVVMDDIKAQAEAALATDFENATYNQLLCTGRDIVKFCEDRRLHVSTVRWAFANSQLMHRPLIEVSQICEASDRAAREATAKTVASTGLTDPDKAPPLTPVRKSPRAHVRSRMVSSSVSGSAAKRASAPVVLRKSSKFKLETKRIPAARGAAGDVGRSVLHSSARESSATSSASEDPFPRDSQEQSLSDIHPMTPWGADRSFDGDPFAQGQTGMLDLRKVYEDIAFTVPDIEAKPVDGSMASSSLRSALQGSVESRSHLGLTTQPFLKQCVQARQEELKKAEGDGKAKALTRMTNSDVLRVKTHMYVPGDDVWSIKAPPLNEGFQPWLPMVDKQHRISLSYNDAMNVESLARVLQKNGAIIESALLTLSSYLEGFQDDDSCAQFHSLLGSLVRDKLLNCRQISPPACSNCVVIRCWRSRHLKLRK